MEQVETGFEDSEELERSQQSAGLAIDEKTGFMIQNLAAFRMRRVLAKVRIGL